MTMQSGGRWQLVVVILIAGAIVVGLVWGIVAVINALPSEVSGGIVTGVSALAGIGLTQYLTKRSTQEQEERTRRSTQEQEYEKRRLDWLLEQRRQRIPIYETFLKDLQQASHSESDDISERVAKLRTFFDAWGPQLLAWGSQSVANAFNDWLEEFIRTIQQAESLRHTDLDNLVRLTGRYGSDNRGLLRKLLENIRLETSEWNL
ncbi:MAG TPA: hypothetical protein VJ183_05150 [Chloroflexia bacterium]|nr:hypothetical protein [Chloroflexia bacterium]